VRDVRLNRQAKTGGESSNPTESRSFPFKGKKPLPPTEGEARGHNGNEGKGGGPNGDPHTISFGGGSSHSLEGEGSKHDPGEGELE